MPTEALTPGIRGGGGVAGRRFDPRSAAPFVYKSTSEETRRAYRRTLLEFFRFVGMRHPADVAPGEVLRWRDTLRSQKKSAATVSFKLSVVRSFFEHLRAAGAVTLNPAATRLVPPPEVSSQPAGRALTAKEVRYLLAGPNREASSGRKARELRGHTNEVTAIAFSPARRELASAATDGTVKLWDWESGRLRHSLTLPGRTTAVFGIAYSPRGDKIADIRSDSLVSVWDAASGRLLLSGESGLKHLGAVTFSSGGGEMIVGGESEGGKGGLEVWRPRDGTGPSRTPLPARVTALALTPRGDELLVGDSSGAMRILDWKAGRLKSSWQAHDGPIREVKLGPGGGQFVTVVSWEEPGVKLWSMTNPAAVLRKFSTEEEGATSMSFSPNGGELAAIGRDNKIRFWAISDGRLIRSINFP